ncbi:MAG: phosphonate C-P lyase system protein PhnH [Candidatus Sedimenticola sp. PURPLELP]
MSAVMKGLESPVFDAQQVFRRLLEAMSAPGSIKTVLPVETMESIDTAAMAVLLSLADYDTPLWLDTAAAADGRLEDHLRFHCGCPIEEDHGKALFALVADAEALPSMELFAQGSESYPDRSTTLIVQVPGLDNEFGWRLTGPGINGVRYLDVAGLPADFVSQWAQNRALFPMGVDIVFTCGDQLAALPRTTRLEV